jgi:hypothetical protein
MNGEEAAVFIDFPGHEFENILLFIAFDKLPKFGLDFRAMGLVPLVRGQFQQNREIIGPCLEFLPWFIPAFKGLKLPHDLFRFGRLVPKVFVPGFGFQFGYLASNGRVLKDASRFLRFFPAIPRQDFLIPIKAYWFLLSYRV